MKRNSSQLTTTAYSIES